MRSGRLKEGVELRGGRREGIGRLGAFIQGHDRLDHRHRGGRRDGVG